MFTVYASVCKTLPMLWKEALNDILRNYDTFRPANRVVNKRQKGLPYPHKVLSSWVI